jgi:hypothetical protein
MTYEVLDALRGKTCQTASEGEQFLILEVAQ